MTKDPPTTTSVRALEQMVYHAVMEFAPWPMAEVEGVTHVVKAVNPWFCALLGKTEAELLDKPIAELFIEGHAAHGLLDRVQLSGEAATHVETASNTPGPMYWSYTCWPVQAKDARHVGLMIQVTQTGEQDRQTRAINEALLISSIQQHELTQNADKLNEQLQDEISERKVAEKALRESEEYNRSITDSSPDCITVLDLDGNLLSMTVRGQALLCIPDIAPYINTAWPDFYKRKEDRTAAVAAVKKAAVGGEGDFMGYFASLDGEPKWWEVRVSPIRDPDGKPSKLLAVSRDVTERIQTELNLAFLASISKDLLLSSNIDEMMNVLGEKIGEYLGLSACAFVEIHEESDQVVVTHDWHRAGPVSFLGVHRMEDFFTEEFQMAGHAGEAFVVSDAITDPRVTASNFAAFNVGSLITVPIVQDGVWRFMLCVYHSGTYVWRPDEVELTRELTARIWTRLERLRSERALRASDERLRFALDSAELGTWSLDTVTGLFNVDERYRAIYGSAASELTVEQGLTALHPDDRELVARAVEASQRSDGSPSLEMEFRVLHPDGSVHWVMSKGRSTFTDKGPARVLTAFAGTVADITERKQGEDRLRQNYDSFFALLNNAPFGFYIVDDTFRMRHVSNAAKKTFAHVHPLIGRDFEDILNAIWPGPLANELARVFRHTLATGEPYAQSNTTEERNDTQEVESYSWKIEHIHMPDGKVGVVCYFFDITEQKKVEQVLREADRRKSEFLATLAHELRNPLAPLRNGLELLALADHDRATWDQAHGMMKRQMDHMVRLIDDLMDLSRISRGAVDLRLEQVDMRTVLDQAIEACKPGIERQEHTLVLDLPDEPVIVRGDNMRLTQVFCNLLNNAAKYTDNGGSIAVRLSTEPDGALVTVEDNGIGIAADQLSKVFDMFAQVERANDRVQGGLGIGLNIVKHLVGMHGGNIEVRSDGLGMGSSFAVHLPLDTTRAKEPAFLGPVARGAKQIAPHRILIVDDNVDAAAMMALLLGKQGHELRVANNGAEALAVGADLLPNVVMMDLGMPVMDGFAACRLMRRTPWGAKALIVAVSGWGQDEDKAKSLVAGFDHHLVKPIGSNALIEIIAANTGVGHS